ncbi:hypothetical protein Ssi03_05900 [Sphaerisporangium siamense]|nr:hypothetical protein Ssi03_05900 [Sphaerisporangium siamense]
MGETIVRVAEDADMPGVREVAAHYEALDGWTDMPDFLDAERAFGTLVVGEVDERIVGIGGVLRRGQISHLSDLYVLPEYQSSGVGSGILGFALPSGTPRVTFSSDDSRALGLYIRQGMRPVCPLMYLTFTPDAATSPGPSGVRAAEGGTDARNGANSVNGAKAGNGYRVREAGAMDARASGGERTGTLSWYADLPGVTLHLTGSGYAFARTTEGDLEVGPVGGETPEDCAAALSAAVAAHPAVEEVQVAVPGVHPLLPRLLDTGWEIDDLDTLMASDPGILRLDRYFPHPDLG